MPAAVIPKSLRIRASQSTQLVKTLDASSLRIGLVAGACLATTLGMNNATAQESARVITPDFAVRANLMWQNADVAGRDFVFDKRWGGAIATIWKPSDVVTLTLDCFHLSLDQMPD